MLTTAVLLTTSIAIGFFARSFSRRTRLLLLAAGAVGVVLLMWGQ